MNEKQQFATGGYVDNKNLKFIYSEEEILNSEDTKNLLKNIELLKDFNYLESIKNRQQSVSIKRRGKFPF